MLYYNNINNIYNIYTYVCVFVCVSGQKCPKLNYHVREGLQKFKNFNFGKNENLTLTENLTENLAGF